MNIVLLLFFNLAKPILKVFNQYFKYELCLHDDDDVDRMSMMMKLIRCQQWWWWSNWSDVNDDDDDDDDVIDKMSMMMIKSIRWYCWGVLIHSAVFFSLIKSPKAIMIDSIFLKILIELLKLLKGTVKEMQQKRSISKWKQVIWT